MQTVGFFAPGARHEIVHVGLKRRSRTFSTPLVPSSFRASASASVRHPPAPELALRIHAEGALARFAESPAGLPHATLLRSRESRRRKEPWIERDDVTNAILYVESDAGRFVTGTTISVDLGLRAK